MGQGLKVNKNLIFQDNESAELLEVNGKKSSSKRTHHINICVSDQGVCWAFMADSLELVLFFNRFLKVF